MRTSAGRARARHTARFYIAAEEGPEVWCSVTGELAQVLLAIEAAPLVAPAKLLYCELYATEPEVGGGVVRVSPVTLENALNSLAG